MCYIELPSITARHISNMAQYTKQQSKSSVNKLAALGRAREGGRRERLEGRSFVYLTPSITLITEVPQPEEDIDIYDEVTEDQYQKVVHDTLDKTDRRRRWHWRIQ